MNAAQKLAGGDIAIKCVHIQIRWWAGGEIVLDIESKEKCNCCSYSGWMYWGVCLWKGEVNMPTGKAVHTIDVPEVAGVYWLVAGVGGEAQAQMGVGNYEVGIMKYEKV